jgi:Rieske Fe-S protein
MTSTDREQISLPPDRQPLAAQPQWRQDFPIDWPQDHYVARRDFTKFMVLTSFAFFAGQCWIAVQNFLRERRGQLPLQPIARMDELAVGQARSFNYPEAHDSCLLVRTGADSFVAFGQQCTHLSCAVIPEPDKQRFLCPCHNGAFDLHTGEPLQGPPRRPLPRIKLAFQQGVIYAADVEERTV